VIVMQASLSVAPQLPSAGLQPAQPPAGLGLRALPALLLFDTAIAKAVVVDPTIKQPIIPAEPATVSAEQQPPATEPTMQAPASAPQILPAIPALPVEVPLPEPVPADGAGRPMATRKSAPSAHQRASTSAAAPTQPAPQTHAVLPLPPIAPTAVPTDPVVSPDQAQATRSRPAIVAGAATAAARPSAGQPIEGPAPPTPGQAAPQQPVVPDGHAAAGQDVAPAASQTPLHTATELPASLSLPASPDTQPAAATPGTPTEPSAPRQAVASPAAQVAPALVSMAHTPDGTQRLTLRLDPPELGHVQIRVDRPPEAPAHVDITVDRPETLTLLLRDQPQLQRALDQAGVPPEGRSVTFHVPTTEPAPRHESVPPAGAGAGSAGTGDASYGASRQGGSPTRRQFAEPGDVTMDMEFDQATPANWVRAGLDITA